ncbi:trypsin-like peptidase domain-containing protein [Rhizobium leguminosarum]|uniref:trypsin-like peptidase domain-containing protein n=1 Tax=Rhizobium leguminosarum TaxID=384 RepID=UPI001C9463FB|nr:trypsin-like peptidase domain-containing protein [Rhizobium leguminosarum]MBY5561076.1 hypothetical protein [Rhizobium leguminosarum]
MWKPLAVSVMAFLLGGDGAFASWPADVVRVQASGCKSDSGIITQTGVRVKGFDGYLTALHGVIGCHTILVSIDGEGKTKPLRVTDSRVDLANDVALLTAPDLPGDGGRPAATSVNPKEELTIVGFPGATNSPWYLTVDVTPVETSRRWIDADPTAVSMIQDRKLPSGATSPGIYRQMITVQGPVAAGHSGAPVWNGKGEVVGLAEGGLSSKAASFVVPIWCINPVDRASVQSDYDALSQVPLSALYSADGKLLGIDINRDNLLKYARLGGAREISLLASSLTADSHDPGGPTALMLAVKGGHFDVVRTLLAAGAEPGFQTADGGVPEAAVEGGNLSVISAVLGFEPDMTTTPSDRNVVDRAMKAAISHNRGDIVTLILQNRPTAFLPEADAISPVARAIKADAGKALEALITFAKITGPGPDVLTLFKSSVSQDKPAAAAVLAKVLDDPVVDGCNPLGYAARQNAAKVVGALADRATINTKACGLDTAVFVADKADATEAERVLLELQPFVRNPYNGDHINHWMLDNYHQADQANNDLLLKQLQDHTTGDDSALKTLQGIWDIETKKSGGSLSAAAYSLRPKLVRAMLERDDFKIYPGSICGDSLPADAGNFPIQATLSGLAINGDKYLDSAIEIIGMLLDRDPNYGELNCGEWTAARMAGRNVGILKFLDGRRAHLEFDWHATALVEAILSKNSDTTDYLLQNDDAVCKSASGSFDSYRYYATGDDDNAAEAALFSDDLAVLRRIIARQSEIRPQRAKAIDSSCGPSFPWLLREACERDKKAFAGLAADAPPISGIDRFDYEYALVCALDKKDSKTAETLFEKGAKVAEVGFDRLNSHAGRDAVCKANALELFTRGVFDSQGTVSACASP